MQPPRTKFATVGDDRVAYQVFGDGPIDLVYTSSLGEAIDIRWDYPPYEAFLRRLASFTRLILFDRRGLGGSDPVSLNASTWEAWADDVDAVLDAAGSKRAVIFGWADAGPVAMLYAASRPERTQALILANTAPRNVVAPDYPWGLAQPVIGSMIEAQELAWGSEELASLSMPDVAPDPLFASWTGKLNRAACSPKTAATHMRWLAETDMRSVLPSIRVPTLVLSRERMPYFSLDQMRDLADQIPGAKFVAVPGADMTIWTEPNEEVLAAVEEFVTGARATERPDRALAAVLFTDIVGSTDEAARLGDRRWRQVIDSHDSVTRTVVERHGGRVIKLTGDGALATFDGPGRAIGCALALREALQPLGISIRGGLHTGEIELRGDDIGGIGVHVAARVLDQAEPNEILVSAAVPLLVAGSGRAFGDRGHYELKGIPGSWQLFVVEA